MLQAGGSAMVRKTEKKTTAATANEVAIPTRNIATFFLVSTVLELVALPLLCYEFAFRARMLEVQLENFRGDPQPGAMAAALPARIRHEHETMLSCFLYTGFTAIKQIFNILLLIGLKKGWPRLVLSWTWGFPALHAAASAVALFFGVRDYFHLDVVSLLVLLHLFLTYSVILAQSAVVLARTARRQLQAVAAGGATEC